MNGKDRFIKGIYVHAKHIIILTNNSIIKLTIYPFALYNLFFDNPIFSSPFDRSHDVARGPQIQYRHTANNIIAINRIVNIGNIISN